ncbi:NAD(+) diphosphatase [Agromyces sp. CFH 90414]|uniref:NAD(+) diphosphatase n=1 Tax=Agromyces agglutinans TaxID=2662258 RepID=A0A6I2F935_9MICO|nr:NAD(+) diphosphatase [Agromyces agglutinans]MRG60754.1 NAD(+) diphosphatase [Agromyces agglutinans]
MHALPPLARTLIDRDADARALDDLAERLDADPTALAVAVHAGRLLVAQQVEGSAPQLELRHPSKLPDAPERAGSPAPLRIYLGRLQPGGAPVELRVLDDESALALEPEAARWQGLRQLATVLDDAHASLATEAIALAGWHERHPRCPRCGAATEPVQAGWARRCEADASLHFPRTDPAVIVLVTDDDDRVLLGSNAMWEQRRFSLLAGFVEPGESLEAAVVREIGEEAGVAVDRVEYVASQPWPFPASIMLGFRARVAAGVDPATARADGEEILELRWFTREELAAAADDGVVVPGSASIARWLLDGWFGGPVPDSDLPWTTR